MDKKKGKLKWTMLHRSMGILFAAVMVFNTLPVSGFAVSASEMEADDDTPDIIASVTTSVGEELCTSPDSFVNAIKGASGEVDAKLLQNIDLGSLRLEVPSDMTLTLDCGEWILSGAGAATVDVDGTFNFTGGTLLNSNKIGTVVAVWQNGKFNMSGGLVDSLGGTGNDAVQAGTIGANVTVTNGTIGVKGRGLFVTGNNTATLSGGTYSSIYAPEKTVANIVKEGYALWAADGLISRDTLISSGLKNVTIVPCTHDGAVTDNGNGTHSGECPYCGTAVEEEFHTPGTDNKCIGCGTELVVRVGIGDKTTYYGSIESAWTAATAADVPSATVTLLGNVETGTVLYVDSNIAFNGGAYSLTGTDDLGVFSVCGGKLTITDGTVTSSSLGVIVSGAELEVTGGTIQATDASGYGIAVMNGSTVHISGGTIKGGHNAVAMIDGGKVSSLLANYGGTTGTHYAFYKDNIPVTSGLDSSFLPGGTYTVGECGHGGEICGYQPIAGSTTHKKTCLACGNTDTMECTYSDDNNPIPNDDGTHILTCADCGSTKTEDCSGGTDWKSDAGSHWHECICGNKSDTAAHTEDGGSVTKEPTEKETGVMTYKCSVCDCIIRTESIDTLPHTHSYGTVWESDGSSHWHECACGDKSDTAAHTEDGGSVTKPATETEKGVKTYKCIVCGYVMRTEDIGNTQDSKVSVSKISIAGISGKIAAGKKIKLTAEVFPENAVDRAVTWSSSNPKYATVGGDGTVTTKKAGAGKSVTITATAKDGSGIQAQYQIKLMKDAVKKVKIKASTKTVKAGSKLKLKAEVTTTGKNANKKLKWASSNESYATVSASGVVKTTKAGKGKTVTITAMATDGTGKKAKIKVKIQ